MSVQLAVSPFPATDGVSIARQPIHDRWKRVVGYELLIGGPSLRAPLDEERTTASVIVEAFTGLGISAVVGNKPAHVRVSRRFLLELSAFALPSDRVVLEIAPPDRHDAAMRKVLEQLHGQGYRISLLCGANDRVPDPELTRLAHSVKLDVASLSPNELASAADRFAAAAPVVIAAGVDSPSLAQRCHALGFHAFQGFYFCAPDIVHGQLPPMTRLGELRSLAGLYAQTITFEEFERIIARDVGLSYRLLCYLNSAFFNLPRRVASVREALMMLGMKAVRRWATLIALSGNEARPNELTVTALLRGRLCELIGRRRPSPTVGADAFFTVGLFSVMDAIMNAPLEQVLDALPLASESRIALLQRTGPMGDAIAATVAYERGDFAAVEALLPGLNMTELYLGAVHWADAACGALGAEEQADVDAQESDGEEDAGDGDDVPVGSLPS
ncbi:MAG TPA: HDOD domain-containing protein [Conexibacter sp.]|jgi:EAL and modified HD-GYP domain-containing signal transduction protein